MNENFLNKMDHCSSNRTVVGAYDYLSYLAVR